MPRSPACLLSVGLLAACTHVPPPPIVQQPMTARPAAQPENTAANGAIYGSGRGFVPLFEDRRARHVGDTLVVVISEKTAANKKGESQVERTAEVAAAVPTLQGVPGKSMQGLSVAGSSSNKFDGSGQSSSNNDFTGTISVTVTEVLSNGNLIVSGEKQIAMTEGTEYIRFSGVVNPRTIALGNTVTSTQVADARLEYKANGYLDSARVMGWLGRFFLTFLPF